MAAPDIHSAWDRREQETPVQKASLSISSTLIGLGLLANHSDQTPSRPYTWCTLMPVFHWRCLPSTFQAEFASMLHVFATYQPLRLDQRFRVVLERRYIIDVLLQCVQWYTHICIIDIIMHMRIMRAFDSLHCSYSFCYFTWSLLLSLVSFIQCL